ncbi:MAG TPA: DASS family sodium-coupled anion symporter [Vicinamibacterales bacterium]|nr:DASS family sodium-coupled anion symporter [Vicinamibacterales bacterium]
MADRRSPLLPRIAATVLLLGIWLLPPPEGLSLQAWRLFGIFAAAIFAVVVNALPILTASVLAIAVAVLTGLLQPEAAYSGFGNGTILLIVVAFLVADAVVKCGLGTRSGHLLVSRFGRSTLGLSYSIFLLDAIIAPAFPSNTARSGVLYPLAFSLANAAGAKPDEPARRRLGGFLMFSGIASLSVSSALWLTAMAANPLGAEIARGSGVEIGFANWLVASSVPTLIAIGVLPPLLYRVIRPEVQQTPDAPAAARRALAALGPLKRQEWIVLIVFVSMVVLWGLAATLGLDSTAIAFLGLGALLATGVITLGDIRKQGDVLATFIWFAVLFTISSQLNELGFMGFVGERLAHALGGLASPTAGLILVFAYVLLHYLFVSQTAHLLALFGVFLDVGVKLGVNPAVLAFQLLFATNYFSTLTPQGSSANLLFAGSGYLTQGELYKYGALTTGASVLIYFVIGTAWLMLVAR